MATETDHLHHHHHHHHQTYGDKWSCLELSSDREESQDVSISQIPDCGSISFGRYTADTLAWEKYSVFSHNRCQEELEKFKAPGLVAQKKAPGLVAQKKAYFEEYYKKIRAMKGLQAEQETTQTDPSDNGQESTAQEENGVDAEASKEESKCSNSNTSQEADAADVCRSKEKNKPCNVHKIQILDNHTTSNNSSRRGINNGAEEKSNFSGNSGRARKADEMGVCLSARITKHSMEGGSSSCTPSAKGSSKTTQKGSPISNKVKHSGSQLKKQASTMRAKGTVASAANRTKSDCRISKDVVKPSEKPKPSVFKEITGKADVSLVSSKTGSNVKSDRVHSHRQLREVQSGTRVRVSLTEDKMVSLSSNIRGGPLKTHSTPKSLADRLPATSAVLTRSAQRSLKEMTTISSMRKSSVYNRTCNGFGQRSLGLSGHHSLPKSRESEKQRPQVMFKNLPGRNKSNQSTGLVCQPNSSVNGQRQKKENAAGLGRPKPDSSKGTGFQRASNLKFMNKSATTRSAELTRDQRDSRQRMPIWR